MDPEKNVPFRILFVKITTFQLDISRVRATNLAACEISEEMMLSKQS